MPDGGVKGFQGLAGQGASGPVAGRNGDDGRKSIPDPGERIQRGFGVERVEAGLDEQQVDAAGDEGGDLFLVDGRKVIERKGTTAAVGQVGRQGQRFGRGADTAGYPDFPAGPVRFRAGKAGTGQRHFGGPTVHAIFFLRDPVAAERIGFDDIGAGLDIGAVYAGHQIGLRQIERVEIAAAAAALEQGSRRTVEQQDPLPHHLSDIIVHFHAAKVRN